MQNNQKDDGLLYLSFNQDQTCLVVGTETGFRLYDIVPLKLRYQRVLNGGIGIIEMMYKWKLPIQICNMILFKTIIESGVYDNYNIDYINGLLMTESKSFLDRVY